MFNSDASAVFTVAAAWGEDSFKPTWDESILIAS